MEPATMIFDTGDLPGNVDTTPLFKTPAHSGGPASPYG